MKKINKIALLIFVVLSIVATVGITIYQIEDASAQSVAQATQIRQSETSGKGDYFLLTASEVEKAYQDIPKTPPTNKKIIDESFYNVAVARVQNRNGAPELHKQSDRVFFVKKGKAVMRIGGTITDPQESSPGEFRSASGKGYEGYKEVTIETGAILSIPRNVPYQVMAEKMNVSYTVVRIN